jgi:hypothetical protein
VERRPPQLRSKRTADGYESSLSPRRSGQVQRHLGALRDRAGHRAVLMTALAADLTGDGWPDIYVASDSTAAILYRKELQPQERIHLQRPTDRPRRRGIWQRLGELRRSHSGKRTRSHCRPPDVRVPDQLLLRVGQGWRPTALEPRAHSHTQGEQNSGGGSDAGSHRSGHAC